jgi:mannose-6-phosphate isomerase-like protein (cupin superfamily)
MSSANLEAVLSTVSEPWKPVTDALFNGNEVMVAKGKDSYPWHKHEDSDDFFLVLKGRLTIEMRDRSVNLGPSELFVVPRGVEHRPVVTEEAYFVPIEPSGTANSGTTLV